jgi:hypothetical protein
MQKNMQNVHNISTKIDKKPARKYALLEIIPMNVPKKCRCLKFREHARKYDTLCQNVPNISWKACKTICRNCKNTGCPYHDI